MSLTALSWKTYCLIEQSERSERVRANHPSVSQHLANECTWIIQPETAIEQRNVANQGGPRPIVGQANISIKAHTSRRSRRRGRLMRRGAKTATLPRRPL